MTKRFFQVYIPGVRDLYTWHFSEAPSNSEDNEASATTLIGALIKTTFRNRPSLGLVIYEVSKPEFPTQPILSVVKEQFCPSHVFDLAAQIADENFCSITKILARVIPKEFFLPKTEVKRQVSYDISNTCCVEIKAAGLDSFFKLHKITGTKQRQAIQTIFDQTGPIDEKILRKDISLTVTKALLDKKFITKQTGKIIPGLALYNNTSQRRANSTSLQPQFYPLTSEQQVALDQILAADKPTLLWGVTGSGKTEVYKQVIQKILFSSTSHQKQALFLLPEIALTPQLIEGFEHSFGAENIAIWHSKLSTQQKIQEWTRITSGKSKILIGTRSAVLLPINNPAVIIMDEEHEWTYKNEFAPRFWTHDVVEKICQNRRANSPSLQPKLILGSATPRLESFHRVKNNDWQMSRLTKRVKDTPLPNFSVIDLRQEIKKNNPSPISERLNLKITDALKRKKQVVLFLNKRGYSASTMCQFCSHTFECPDCDSKMKAHKKINRRRGNNTREQNLFSTPPSETDEPVIMHKLVCHVCGHLEWFPDECPKCNKKNFAFKGWGTQQVEEELKKLFPTSRIVRADADTVTKKSDWSRIHQLFKNKKADILLGTQMITKGLDFEDVELVGVILADVGLNLPDFRAEERVFQLITQVAGRAGRREKQGHIVLQTFQPEAKVFDYILRYDTQGFIDWQSQERQKHNFPPYCQLAKLTISHEDKTVAFKTAKEIEAQLTRNNKSSNQLDFELLLAPAFFPRTHGKYHFHIYIKTADKDRLKAILTPFKDDKRVKIDSKPSSIL